MNPAKSAREAAKEVQGPGTGNQSFRALIPWVAAILTYFLGGALGVRAGYYGALQAGLQDIGATPEVSAMAHAMSVSSEAGFIGAVAAYIAASIVAVRSTRLKGLLLGSSIGLIVASLVGFLQCYFS